MVFPVSTFFVYALHPGMGSSPHCFGVNGERRMRTRGE
ncbi:hypothetical protein LEMLEM_LOCUS7937 [Lemmus lemmus]